MVPDEVGGVAVVEVGVGEAEAAAEGPHPGVQGGVLGGGDPPHVGAVLLGAVGGFEGEAGFPAAAHPAHHVDLPAAAGEGGEDVVAAA